MFGVEKIIGNVFVTIVARAAHGLADFVENRSNGSGEIFWLTVTQTIRIGSVDRVLIDNPTRSQTVNDACL